MRNIVFAVAGGMLAALAAAPAGAGDYYGVDHRDRVHADSFGNLVIHSHAGHKRIIVGMGEIAESYNLTGSYYEPKDPQVVYLEEQRRERHARRCSRPPHVWHGRAHIYGLPDGVVPQAPVVCR